MPRRFRSNRFPKARGVNLHWTRLTASFLNRGAGTEGVTLVASQHQRETCLRIRGQITATVDGLQASGMGIRVALGIIPVPDGTGTTVLWSPVADGDAPWQYWTAFHIGYEEMVTDVVDVPMFTSYREVIDNKAMRIYRPDTEMQLVVEATTITGAGNFNLYFDARALSQQS